MLLVLVDAGVGVGFGVGGAGGGAFPGEGDISLRIASTTDSSFVSIRNEISWSDTAVPWSTVAIAGCGDCNGTGTSMVGGVVCLNADVAEARGMGLVNDDATLFFGILSPVINVVR